MPQPFWAFVLLQPLPLAMVLAKQHAFCTHDVHQYAAARKAYDGAATLLRTTASWGSLSPEWAAPRAAAEPLHTLCTKVQVWVTLVLGYFVPSLWCYWMGTSERQRRQRLGSPRSGGGGERAAASRGERSTVGGGVGANVRGSAPPKVPPPPAPRAARGPPTAPAIWALGVLLTTCAWQCIDAVLA